MGVFLSLTACQNGGDLTLEPGSRRPASNKGSPYVQVNQGGKALVVEQGKTASTGVHGWVTIQSVTASQLQGGSARIILNKTQAFEK